MNSLLLAGAAALMALMLAGCGNTKPPPVVESGDPVRQLNPTKWVATQADLETPTYFAATNGR